MNNNASVLKGWSTGWSLLVVSYTPHLHAAFGRRSSLCSSHTVNSSSVLEKGRLPFFSLSGTRNKEHRMSSLSRVSETALTENSSYVTLPGPHESIKNLSLFSWLPFALGGAEQVTRTALVAFLFSLSFPLFESEVSYVH